jgi:uncharacterized protein YkwD
MKSNLFRVLSLVMIICIIGSCSSDNSESQDTKVSSLMIMNYTYISSELETMELINAYRVGLGLNKLEKINHISYKSEEHNIYMIANNVVNHNDFIARSQNIKNVLGAKMVEEIIAYDYNSPKGAFNAWMNSTEHKECIIGNYTHFGISIRENPVTGIKYYTTIFAKI